MTRACAAHVEKMIAEMDVDHDGMVTLDEIVSTYLEFLVG